MADLPLLELEWRIALLPPISRGVHLGGPALHAQRLTKLWEIATGDDVSLAQAFRLLDVAAIEAAILHVAAAKGDFGNSRHWTFPSFQELLPELRDLCWQAMVKGTLLVKALKGERGRRRRTVLPTELPRLTPDWELSRLCRSANDEFIDVRVRRAPAVPVKKAWRSAPTKEELKAATEAVAETYPPGAQPPFDKEILPALRAHLPDLPRDDARAALKDYAPRLLGRRGHRSTKSRS